MHTLNDLFLYADIDDVWETADGVVYLEFTTRKDGKRHEIEGIDLAEAVELARKNIARDIAWRRLREEGLREEDIDKIVAEEDAALEAAEAWDRGYEAGVYDAVYAETKAQEAVASVNPAMAAAAEPVDVLPQQFLADEDLARAASLDNMPLLTVIYRPIAIVRERDR